ncbi:MAG TPA: carbohydrate kinase family protein [Candidatus Nanopusillus sp.]|nr:carbohydrate kinase family protein [Archaeoglobus profundus]HIP66784.1 carbohydrate kinase family protein [Candidatus Nanopusillus sp.]
MIAGIGPALVDYIYAVDSYPAKGGHTVIKNFIKMAGGAAANVICCLASLGVKCRFYSTVGKDEDAKFFIESMKGVDLRLNITHSYTGKVHIYVDKDGERTFFVQPNASGVVNLNIEEKDYKDIEYFYLDPFPTQKSLDIHIDIARKAKEYNKTVILNPGYPYTSLGFEKLSKLLRFTDVVIMSKDEFNMLNVKGEDILQYVDILVITLGERGSKAITRDREYYQPAFRVKVVDTTGAGDAFSAGFIYGLMKDLPLDLCLKIGNYIASYNVQYYGARNFPSRDNVESFIKNELANK